eukprot:3856602-Pyramimonas_sp.AAC.1
MEYGECDSEYNLSKHCNKGTRIFELCAHPHGPTATIMVGCLLPGDAPALRTAGARGPFRIQRDAGQANVDTNDTFVSDVGKTPRAKCSVSFLLTLCLASSTVAVFARRYRARLLNPDYVAFTEGRKRPPPLS